MTTDTNFIKYISPNIAAKKLGVAVTTLRKYSSLIEKFSGNKSYFERDTNNSRIYTYIDISVLERIIELKAHPNFSLEKSIRQVLSEKNVAIALDENTRHKSATKMT